MAIKNKLKKLYNNPKQYFADAVINLRNKLKASENINRGKVLYAYAFSQWKKGFLQDWFPNNHLVFLPKPLSKEIFFKDYVSRVLKDSGDGFLIWGMNAPEYLLKFLQEHNISYVFIEDGLIRSIDLGASKVPPFSLSIDSRTPYFNAQTASDLELMLSQCDFGQEPETLVRARNFIDKLVHTGISKYNQSTQVDIQNVYGKKVKKRVLVIGQVEDDASIVYGCDNKLTNNELVMIAHLENPDAEIIYKPHPDVLHKKRVMQSNPKDVKHICKVLEDDMPLSQSFETIDHVYTITSQAGFEALMRGIKVTTMGCPFYSGWGLTDDRQPNSRRTVKLSIEEIVAVVYFQYLKYFDPILKKSISAEEAIDQLVQLRGGR